MWRRLGTIRSILTVIGAGFLGGVTVRLLPESWVIYAVLMPFGTCIIMGWIFGMLSEDFKWSDLWGIFNPFFSSPFKLSTLFSTIKNSFFLWASILLASFAIGACISLILGAGLRNIKIHY
jgi:hypothetical protein